jgi:hypothetical protein
MRLRKLARTAGTVVLVLVALDLVAAAATIAVGAVLLKR